MTGLHLEIWQKKKKGGTEINFSVFDIGCNLKHHPLWRSVNTCRCTWEGCSSLEVDIQRAFSTPSNPAEDGHVLRAHRFWHSGSVTSLRSWRVTCGWQLTVAATSCCVTHIEPICSRTKLPKTMLVIVKLADKHISFDYFVQKSTHVSPVKCS